MAVPMVHGFDPVALTYPIRPSPPSPDVARRNLAGYRAATWAETFLPHALLGIRNRVHAAWLAAPDVIALVVVFDGWEQMEPDSPDVWGTPSGPRWLGMITEMTADGNWWNPWTPDYLGEFYMLISEFDALYADRLRREHPEHFPRNDIYAERRPDPREVELAAAILDRIPPSGPRSPRTAAVTPAGAESVVSVGLIGGALITDLGPAGLLYSWAYGNFLLTPETGRYWQEQAGAEGPLGRPIETTTPGPDGALVTYFEHGFVYWHPDTGFCSEAGGAGRGDVPSADALAWVRTHRPPDPK
ncbi:hypothetical protein [Granulicoccus phenolivorans]|uniref:hypothetical protein n=1 Tax=Granulicoccus phenolivorans TaxID=266854 RepID=UPI0011AEACE2|nr:hypothetical protein [Granulicoccus phenolivorans]